jgi:dTDP-4-dehydrorhamnose 3,5-epimerase-like enzyme
MYTINEDQRGIFRGITNKYTWGEINLVETRAHIVRGNHYHTYTKELFYILEGNIQVTVFNLFTKKTNTFIATPHTVFIVDPYEVHTFTTLDNSRWINMLSHKLDENSPDIHRCEGSDPNLVETAL